MNRKWLLVLVIVLFALSSAAGFAAPKLKVVLYINGTLGDKSFFDSANRGVLKAAKELAITAKVIEGTYDSSRWEPDLAQLCEGDWDLIIAGTWQLQEALEKFAPQYPKKKFITYRYHRHLQQGRSGQRLLHSLQAERGVFPRRRACGHGDQLQHAARQQGESRRLPRRDGHSRHQ